MIHKIKFYPLGNADTSLILLKNGKRILFDYAATKTNEDDDKRIDLPVELNKDVPNDYDVLAITHADDDHIRGFSDYFYLEHDEKYQKGTRKKIKDLWVPAAVILHEDKDIKNPEAKILKYEALHRLKNSKKVKVFSQPESLAPKLKDYGINFEDIKHLVIAAGRTIPGWNIATDGIEFFVHSPFSTHVEDREINRNEACLIVQAVFDNAKASKIIFGADGLYEVWDDIITLSKLKKKTERLQWDIFHISHHSSYLSLNKDKGKQKTVPTDKIKWLFEEQGQPSGLLISPSKETPAGYDDVFPPHLQAMNYYKEVAILKGGEFIVTMEFPSKEKPDVLVVTLGDFGIEVEKKSSSIDFVYKSKPPRAGM